jgi:hypothetical protein
LLETVFSVHSVQSGYKEDNWGVPVSWGLAIQLSSAREPQKRWRYRLVESWKSCCEEKTLCVL